MTLTSTPMGWVGTVHYRRYGVHKQLRFADRNLGPCWDRLELAMFWIWWRGYKITASALGRGLIWGGKVHWDDQRPA